MHFYGFFKKYFQFLKDIKFLLWFFEEFRKKSDFVECPKKKIREMKKAVHQRLIKNIFKTLHFLIGRKISVQQFHSFFTSLLQTFFFLHIIVFMVAIFCCLAQPNVLIWYNYFFFTLCPTDNWNWNVRVHTTTIPRFRTPILDWA